MSQTTSNLNAYIARLNEDLTVQIKRAYEAEQDADIMREARNRMSEQLMAKRTLDARHEQDMERMAVRISELERENRYLANRLDSFMNLRIAEAAKWLRETDINEMNTILNEAQTKVEGYDRPPMKATTDKIPMIKLVRDRFDLGLKESKDLVDAWYAEMKETFDAMLAASPSINPFTGIEQYQAESR